MWHTFFSLLTFVKIEFTFIFFTKSLTSESGGLYITPTIKIFLLGRQTSMNSDSTDNDSSVSIDKSFQNLNCVNI